MNHVFGVSPARNPKYIRADKFVCPLIKKYASQSAALGQRLFYTHENVREKKNPVPHGKTLPQIFLKTNCRTLHMLPAAYHQNARCWESPDYTRKIEFVDRTEGEKNRRKIRHVLYSPPFTAFREKHYFLLLLLLNENEAIKLSRHDFDAHTHTER